MVHACCTSMASYRGKYGLLFALSLSAMNRDAVIMNPLLQHNRRHADECLSAKCAWHGIPVALTYVLSAVATVKTLTLLIVC